MNIGPSKSLKRVMEPSEEIKQKTEIFVFRGN